MWQSLSYLCPPRVTDLTCFSLFDLICSRSNQILLQQQNKGTIWLFLLFLFFLLFFPPKYNHVPHPPSHFPRLCCHIFFSLTFGFIDPRATSWQISWRPPPCILSPPLCASSLPAPRRISTSPTRTSWSITPASASLRGTLWRPSQSRGPVSGTSACPRTRHSAPWVSTVSLCPALMGWVSHTNHKKIFEWI